MKLSWLFVILLLVFVAVFSVQNAGVITVHFLSWEITMSAALVIQLAALLGGLVGLAFGAWSRRTARSDTVPAPAKPAGVEPAATRPATPVKEKPLVLPPPSTSSSPAPSSPSPPAPAPSAGGSSPGASKEKKPGT